MAISRRTFLGGALAAGALASTGVAGLTSAQAASRSPLFGTDDVNWAAFTRAVSGVRGRRFTAHGVPRSFPRPGGVSQIIQNFNPDPEQVIRGSLDRALVAYAKTIPNGGIVCPLLEGERANLHHTAAEVTGAIDHCYKIIKEHAPGCRVVQTLTCYSLISRKGAFDSYLSHQVDAIYMDAYQHDTRRTVANFVKPCADAIRSATGKPLGIAECNSWMESERPSWFSGLWALALSDRYEVFYPFFTAPGDGPPVQWVSHDDRTIGVLRMIAAEA
ncbi:MAG: hypothetical protein ABSA03_12505 [Streptosporangiaceae bacterium]|jgi:hypothetical protein